MLRGAGIESDQGHEHVIEVMRQVYDQLKALYRATKSNKDTVRDIKKADDMVQSFQLLNVDALESDEEAGEASGTTSVSATISKSTKDKLKKRRRKKAKERMQQACLVEESDDDPYFALICLLFDLESMREYIREVWMDYKDGKVDLTLLPSPSMQPLTSFGRIRMTPQP